MTGYAELLAEASKNYYELTDPTILRKIEQFFAEHPMPNGQPLTTIDIKHLTKCASYALEREIEEKTGVDYDATVLTRAFAYGKIGAARIESEEFTLENSVESIRQPHFMRAHFLTHGANFLRKLVDKTNDNEERIKLLELACADVTTAIDILKKHESKNTHETQVQLGKLEQLLSAYTTGNTRIDWLNKAIKNKIETAVEFSSNTVMASMLYSEASELEFQLALMQPLNEKIILLKSAYSHMEDSFELLENFEHPSIARRYGIRAHIAINLMKSTRGKESLEWRLTAIYNLERTAERRAKTEPEDEDYAKELASAAKDYSTASHFYFGAAIDSRDNPADEIEFIKSAIETAKKSLEVNKKNKDEKNTAIVQFNIGRYINWQYNITKNNTRQKDRALLLCAKEYLKSAKRYFSDHPEQDKELNSYGFRAQKALTWINNTLKDERKEHKYKESDSEI